MGLCGGCIEKAETVLYSTSYLNATLYASSIPRYDDITKMTTTRPEIKTGQKLSFGAFLDTMADIKQQYGRR